MKGIFQILILWLVLGGGYLFSLPLKYRAVINDGAGDVVSAVVYLERVVKQGGGTISYAEGSKQALEQIKIPTYYQKGQQIGEIINNFCNLYRVVGYQFKGQVLTVLAVGKGKFKSRSLADYRIRKGAFLFGFGWQANFFKAELDAASLGMEFSIDSPLFPITMGSFELMLSDHWGLLLSYANFGVGYDDVSHLEGWYDFLNLMVNYHFDLGRFNCFVGAGITQYWIDWEEDGIPVDTVFDPDAKGIGDKNFAISLAVGSYFRIYKRLYLGARFIFGLPGVRSLSGGVYVKL